MVLRIQSEGVLYLILTRVKLILAGSFRSPPQLLYFIPVWKLRRIWGSPFNDILDCFFVEICDKVEL